MATDHERPAKFSQGWQPTALRLTNSRSSSCALGVDPLAVRHMPEEIIVAEQGIEAGCDLGQPALCAGWTGRAPIGVPIGPVIALHDPDGHQPAQTRQASTEERRGGK